MVGTFKTMHLTTKPQVQIDAKSSSLFDQNRYSYPIWPKFDPNLVHLAHFVSGVGSSNLIYVLAVVITFRNLL